MMNIYIVKVQISPLDDFDSGQKSTGSTYISVQADTEENACRTAVLSLGTTGVVELDDSLNSTCDNTDLSLTYVAIKCRYVDEEELLLFNSLTDGVSNSDIVCDTGCWTYDMY
jgi:hypothetical protein